MGWMFFDSYKVSFDISPRKAQLRHVEQMLTAVVERFLKICVAGSAGSCGGSYFCLSISVSSATAGH